MRIVIVDDDEFDFRLVKRNLERAFSLAELTFEWVQVPSTADLCLRLDAADICFIDYRMGNVSGLELISELCGAGVITPLVLLTGDESNELDQLAIAAGAADFLHKDRLSVSSIQRLTRHCMARKEQEKRLAEMAYTDQLTGLKNRAAFDKRCQMLFAESVPQDQRYGMILIDLDHFKEVNDTYGHPAGDALLKAFAAELARQFDEGSMVARLGGDEFGVVLELTDPDTTQETIRDQLRKHLETTFDIGGLSLRAECSIGVVIVDQRTRQQAPSDVLNRADRNMYSDKRLRHLLVRESRRDPKLGGIEIQDIVRELSLAIERGELALQFQPKVNCRSGDVTGMEALLRWNHPAIDLGPSTFVPIAEEYGLMRDIGRWVIQSACMQIRTWAKSGFTAPRVAINVSPVQLEDPNFSAMVMRIFEETGVVPALIEFELTEGAFGRGLDACIEQMQLTADIGCLWAIDDFGVGYSSLSRLHKLPISRLKIDRSFLEQIPDDPAALEISNTIISMARGLNMSVVAEGVEDTAQLEGLNLEDDDEIQGFRYFFPMDPGSTAKALRRSQVTVA